VTRRWAGIACKIQRLRASRRDQDLETLVTRQVNQHARIMRVVLDNEENGISSVRGLSRFVRELFDDALLDRQRRRRTILRRYADSRSHRRAGVFQRQIQREAAAFAGRAPKMNFAPQQTRKLAADGEAEAGAAYFRLVPASACWNASKISFCFSWGNADTVSDTSKATTAGEWLRTGCSAFQPPRAAETAEAYAALGGKLEGVRQQIFQHLLQTF